MRQQARALHRRNVRESARRRSWRRALRTVPRLTTRGKPWTSSRKERPFVVLTRLHPLPSPQPRYEDRTHFIIFREAPPTPRTATKTSLLRMPSGPPPSPTSLTKNRGHNYTHQRSPPQVACFAISLVARSSLQGRGRSSAHNLRCNGRTSVPCLGSAFFERRVDRQCKIIQDT